MRGFRCERKAGWDTHGLPVEVEVSKELGIHSKEEIEDLRRRTVHPQVPREACWRYTRKSGKRLTEPTRLLDSSWTRPTSRIIRAYVESVWWALKNFFDRGLLYQGHKIVWWWAQGGTALSAGEVGQGYREVADPSVYVKFPLLDDDGERDGTSLLVWTTTRLGPCRAISSSPLTRELEYATVIDPEARIQNSFDRFGTGRNSHRRSKIEARIRRSSRDDAAGADLVGRRYVPPFDYYYIRIRAKQRSATLADGTETAHGLARRRRPTLLQPTAVLAVVHQAPAFGEVDYDVLDRSNKHLFTRRHRAPNSSTVSAPNGQVHRRSAESSYTGRWVKEADKDIYSRVCASEGCCYLHQEQVPARISLLLAGRRRSVDPISARKLVRAHDASSRTKCSPTIRQINWLPEHIRDGRFGNFLEANVDWALSRERYWGTPLPIWVCEETGHSEAVDSYDELLAKPGVAGTEAWEEAKAKRPELPDDLKVHKPYIDEITYDSPKAPGKRMRRVPEVIDCWFDSGAMPFAPVGISASKPRQVRGPVSR